MGLDMYLNRAPRYEDATMKDVRAIERWLDWNNRKPENTEYSFEEWTGRKLEDVKLGDYLDFYGHFYQERYYVWDFELKHPVRSIVQEIGYWRKANHIHQWFVDNIQDGVDDCEYHREVTKEDLEKLLAICEEVKNNSKLVQGKISNGYTYENGRLKNNYVDGLFIEDPTVAMEKLPTRSGFFFGGTDYDKWYMDDIEETIKICKKALEETDFEVEMIYYCSSW